MRSKYCKILD